MTQKFLAAEFVNQISDICSRTKTPYTVKDFTVLKELFDVLSVYDHACVVNSWFKLQDDIISLECLWQLQSHGFLQFTTYIYFHTSLIPRLSESFEEQIWCQDESIRQQCSETAVGLLAVLVNLGGHTPRDICKPGQELLTLVVEKFVARLLKAPSVAEKPVPFLSRLEKDPLVVQSRLQVFCLSLLRLMMQSTSLSVTLQEAVQDQTRLYTSGNTPVVSQVFSEILSNMTVEDFVNELIKLIMSEDQFNWRWLLTAVSVLAASPAQEVESFKGVMEEWLAQACVNKNTKLLSAALLCTRQCCAENIQRFGSYSAWFGSLQVRPASAFTFFFNFLSQLVPFEPVLCLKIHVNKIPSAPANCHGVVVDYAALAKTRLADLHQTTDYVGLFGEYTTTEQEGREADVAKVITNFKQNKEIMKIVLEASVFRRQFYEKVFLAELLKDGNPDHVEFIDKLYSIGKIPHGLYNRWRKLFC